MKINKFIILKIIIVISNIIFIFKAKNFLIINNWKIKNQINLIKKYYDLCNIGILINKKKFNLSKNPKISIISTVFNNEKYIIRFLRSIQNQLFNDIEIIFVDDYSKDNSVKIINECQKNDERIILIKQKINRGTLISRNIGVLKSKGDYIIMPDSDDILSNNILKLAYKTAKRNQYEIIRFNFYFNNHIDINYEIFNRKINPIYQPELRTFIFYGLGFLRANDFNICNKFIKRELFIRTINNINNLYLKKYMIYFEDGFMNYALHLNANSLYLMNNIGYYYIYNNQSVTNKLNKNLEIICFLQLLKFIIENTKNNIYEKIIASYYFKAYKKKQRNNTKFLKYLNINIKKMKLKFF